MVNEFPGDMIGGGNFFFIVGAQMGSQLKGEFSKGMLITDLQCLSATYIFCDRFLLWEAFPTIKKPYFLVHSSFCGKGRGWYSVSSFSF